LGKKVKNTFGLWTSQIILEGFGFFYFIFLARFLGVADFGIYSFTIAFVYNFIPVADFGIERLVLRDISREPEKTTYFLKRLLPLRMILAAIAYFLLVILALVFGQTGKQILYLAIFGLALFPYSFSFLLISFLNSREEMKFLAASNIFLILFTGVTGALLVILKFPLTILFFVYPLANFLLAGWFWLNSKELNLPLGGVIDLVFWKKCLSQSWAFATILILAVFYLRLSVVMLNLIKGSVATGLYNSAFKFVEATILIPQSLTLALFPLSSKLIISDKAKLKKIYLKALLILVLLSVPLMFVFLFAPQLLVKTTYGSNYLGAVPVFMILGLSFVFFFPNALAGNIIQNSDKFKRFLPWAVANFLVALILCLILIPRYSIVGAAWAVVGGEIFGLIINNWFVFRILKE